MAHSINTKQQRASLPVSNITTILPAEPLKLIIKSLGPVPARRLALSCKFFNHLCQEHIDELSKIRRDTIRATSAVKEYDARHGVRRSFPMAFSEALNTCRENASLLDEDVKQKSFVDLAASLQWIKVDHRSDAFANLAACHELLSPDSRLPFIDRLWMQRGWLPRSERAGAEKILWAALDSLPQRYAGPTGYGWRASALEYASDALPACMALLQEISSLDGSGQRKDAVLTVIKNLGHLLRSPNVATEIVKQANAIANAKAEILCALLHERRRSPCLSLRYAEWEKEEQECIRLLELVWAQLGGFDDNERTALLKEILMTAAELPAPERMQYRSQVAKQRVLLSDKGQAEVLGPLVDNFQSQYISGWPSDPVHCHANDRVLLTEVLREFAPGLATAKDACSVVRLATRLPVPDYDSVMALLWRRIAQLRPSEIEAFLLRSRELTASHETARRSDFLTQLRLLTWVPEVAVPGRFWKNFHADLDALPEEERPSVICDLLRALAAGNRTDLLQQALAAQLETRANDQARLAWCERLIQAAQKPSGGDAIHGASPSAGANQPPVLIQVSEVLVIFAGAFSRMLASDAWLHLFKQLVAAADAMPRGARPVLLCGLARLISGDGFQACFKLLIKSCLELRPQDQFLLWATLGTSALACGDKDAFKQVLKLSAYSGKPRSELLAAIADLPGKTSQVVQPQAAFVLIKNDARLPAAERTPLLRKLATSGLENQLRALQAESGEKGEHASSVKHLEAALLKLFYKLVEQVGRLDKPLRPALLLDLARQVPKLPENERTAAATSLREMAAKISLALKNQVVDACYGKPGH
ncbi:MAG: hypothetical protein JWP36_1398 [Paucimonas sp.]|nr:hypothetical protein [Paucimonas sp.]